MLLVAASLWLMLTVAQGAPPPPAAARPPAAAPGVPDDETFPIRFARHVPASEATSLKDGDLVLGVVAGGEARAYPLSALWEEGRHVVNDDLGNTPIAVSMCPLAGVGATYLRRSGDEILDIGSLVTVDRGSLVLYDRQTHTTWNLLSGAARGGPLEGHRLGRVATLFTTWARWRALHPATTAYVTPEANPGYELNDRRMQRILRANQGPSLRDRDWVLGLRDSKDAAVVLVRQLLDRRVANAAVDGRPIVVFLAEDLATTSVWERTAGGRTLTFRAEGDRMTDAETGSSWDPFTGRASAGALSAQQLTPVPFTPTFWHSWKAHYPEATVLSPE